MKVFYWLGLLIIILISAFIGTIIGGLAGLIAGPVKAVSWMNESIEVEEATTNDSI